MPRTPDEGTTPGERDAYDAAVEEQANRIAVELATLNGTNLQDLEDATLYVHQALTKLSAVFFDLTMHTPEDLDRRTHQMAAATTVSTIMQSVHFQYGILSKFLGDERYLRAQRDQKDVAKRIMAFVKNAMPVIPDESPF